MRMHVQQKMQQWQKSTPTVKNSAERIKRPEVTESPRKVQNTATHASVTHRISACKLQRIATVAHDSNMTLCRSTKDNKSRCIHACQNIILVAKSLLPQTRYKEP